SKRGMHPGIRPIIDEIHNLFSIHLSEAHFTETQLHYQSDRLAIDRYHVKRVCLAGRAYDLRNIRRLISECRLFARLSHHGMNHRFAISLIGGCLQRELVAAERARRTGRIVTPNLHNEVTGRVAGWRTKQTAALLVFNLRGHHDLVLAWAL